jgi:hypothetical protein
MEVKIYSLACRMEVNKAKMDSNPEKKWKPAKNG